jgi:hypothetical protein
MRRYTSTSGGGGGRSSALGRAAGTILIAVVIGVVLHSVAAGAKQQPAAKPSAGQARYVVVSPGDAGLADLFGGCPPIIVKPSAWWDCVSQHADQIAHPEKAKANAKHRRHSPTTTTRGGRDELG